MDAHEGIVEGAVALIRSRCASAPRVAVVLGSGLGPVAGALEGGVKIGSDEIRGYPASTVEGHAGTFMVGSLRGVPVVVLSGRIHGYEGHPGPVLGLPARILCGLGVKALIVTNAAGGVNRDFHAGDLMVITDHMNMTGQSPLTGPNVPSWGPRFPDMSRVYAPTLRQLAHEVASGSEVILRQGVYACMPGPQYETPAEVRALRILGADAVGMSTVPEAIVAAHMGVPVLGFSVISNAAASTTGTPLSHEEVLVAANEAGRTLANLLLELVGKLADA